VLVQCNFELRLFGELDDGEMGSAQGDIQQLGQLPYELALKAESVVANRARTVQKDNNIHGVVLATFWESINGELL